MTRNGLRRRGLLAASAALLLTTPVMPAGATSEAVLPVQQLVDGLLRIMKAGSATPFQERFAVLQPVIEQAFDLAIILQESIGSAWMALPSEQQTMLTDAFRRYTVASYVNSFDGFNGQRFEVSPETRTVGNDQVVQTKIVPKKGESHELDYVVRRGSAGWRVVDVLADGSISRVAVQRSDFRRLLARGGPQALADSLRMKSTDLSDGTS
jgi:phospholipid transport system substrate-binding protein